jgi:hypothetical protein
MSACAATGFPLPVLIPKQLGLGFNTTCQQSETLRINNKTEPPPSLGRVAGSAYTVNLYLNPTAPLTSLYPKSTGRENRSRQNPTCS